MQGRVICQPTRHHMPFCSESLPCFYQTPRWICKYSFGFRKPQFQLHVKTPHVKSVSLYTRLQIPPFTVFPSKTLCQAQQNFLSPAGQHGSLSNLNAPTYTHAHCTLIAGHSPFKEAHQHSRCQTPPPGCYHSTRWFTRRPVRLTSCPLHRMHYHSA